MERQMKTIHHAISASVSDPIADSPIALRAQLANFLAIMWALVVSAGTVVWLLVGDPAPLQVLAGLGVLMSGLTLHRASCLASWRELPIKHWPAARVMVP